MGHTVNPEAPAVSVVIPCLNEEATLGACIEEAQAALAESPWDGEIVVADNGSTDRSREIAAAAGARVVPVSARGYGAALDAGILAARGKVVVFADADGSYPFSRLAELVGVVMRGEAEFVIGSRLRGEIEPGAMPTLNRYLGTPVLSLLIRQIFRLPVSDCNSGMRAFTRSIYPALDLRCPGMEYASEMLIRVAQTGVVYREVPLPFRKDRRGRPPHLSRWHDGWRHLRFILGHAPSQLVIAPLALTAFVATLIALILSFVPTRAGELRFHTAFSLLAVAAPLGMLAYTFLLVKVGGHTSGRDSRLVALIERLAARSILMGGAALFYGLTALEMVILLLRWRSAGFQELFAIAEVIRISVLSALGTAFLALDVGVSLVKLYVRQAPVPSDTDDARG